ncbi:MAG: Flp family type IVb pilin [Bryobacteraceae bacterium]|jgi:Flp pilus assembly pilin Flp
MQQFVRKFWCEEDGQDLMEYSLFLCFVALACTAFLGIFHPSVTTIWQVSSNSLHSANNAAAPN